MATLLKALAKKKVKAAQKRALIKKQAHDALSAEIRLQQITYAKQEKEWRALLLKYGLEKARNDLEFAWMNFERTMDYKDTVISLMIDERDSADDQNLQNFKNHMMNIEKINDLFHQVLSEMQFDYDNFVNALVEDENKFQEIRNNFMNEEVANFKLQTFGSARRHKAHFDEFWYILLSNQNERNNSYSDMMDKMKKEYSSLMREISEETQNVSVQYESFLQSNWNEYQRLDVKDKLRKAENFDRLNQIKKLVYICDKKKYMFETTQASFRLPIAKANAKHNYFKDLLKQIRQICRDISQKYQEIYEQFVVESTVVIEKLDKFQKKGELILKLMGVCYKLERVSEQILPFPKEKPCKKNIEPSQPPVFETPTFASEYPCTLLNTFWKKVAEAHMVSLQLQEEKAVLFEENMMLQQAIHNYCKCVSCPELQKAKTKPVVVDLKQVDSAYSSFTF